MKTPIDLTQLDSSPCCIEEKSGPQGPTVHFSTKGYELEFPEEGVMTVRFKMVWKKEMPQDERYECTLELVEILKVKSSEPEAPAHGEGEAGSAMDALHEAMMEKEG